MTRHIRDLTPRLAVCARLLAEIGIRLAPFWPKVSGRKLPFPEMLLLVMVPPIRLVAGPTTFCVVHGLRAADARIGEASDYASVV